MLTRRSAIRLAATTAVPNAVVAASTPMSWASSALAAALCSGRSSRRASGRARSCPAARRIGRSRRAHAQCARAPHAAPGRRSSCPHIKQARHQAVSGIPRLVGVEVPELRIDDRERGARPAKARSRRSSTTPPELSRSAIEGRAFDPLRLATVVYGSGCRQTTEASQSTAPPIASPNSAMSSRSKNSVITRFFSRPARARF